MRMVIRVERVDRVCAERLKDASCISSMIHIVYSCPLSRQLGIPDKSVRRIGECSALPWVVGRLAGDQDVGTLLQKQQRRIFDVRWEGEDSLGHPVVHGLTGLIAIARAVSTAVIVGERTAVVVSKLDNNIVACLEDVGDSLEAALAGVGARATTTNGLVRDLNRDAVGNVVTPSFEVSQSA